MSDLTLNVAVPAQVVAAFLRGYAQFTRTLAETVCAVVVDVSVPDVVVEAWSEFQETMTSLPQPHLSQVKINGQRLAKRPAKLHAL